MFPLRISSYLTEKLTMDTYSMWFILPSTPRQIVLRQMHHAADAEVRKWTVDTQPYHESRCRRWLQKALDVLLNVFGGNIV